MSHTVFILAGETSGDLHGASLARALREREADLHLAGLGGPRMAAAGVEVFRDVTAHAAIGFLEALGSLRAYIAALRDMVRRLDERRPDAVVLIDSPEFNLRFARRARRRGIPVAYYIGPQLWAWRRGRIRQIQRDVDRMLVILPFEREFYARHGVEAVFVGHPLLDVLSDYRHDRRFAEQLGLPSDRFVLGLLPGSRRKEVRYLLPPMLGAAERLNRELGGITVALAPAPAVPREQYESWQSQTSLHLHLFPGNTHELMAAADLLIAASGTVTLEAGIVGTPTIVVYRLATLTWWLAKVLVRGVRYCSLVNLVADREVFPELLQGEATPAGIAATALSLVREGGLDRIARDLAADVRPHLGEPGASGRAADEILALLHDPTRT